MTELAPDGAMAALSVAVPALPEARQTGASAVIARAEEALGGTGLVGRLLGRDDVETAKSRLQEVLAAERAERTVIDGWLDQVALSMGQAWLAAGCPGRPSVAEKVQLELEAERRQFITKLAVLEDKRDRVADRLDDVERARARREAALDARRLILEMVLQMLETGRMALRERGLPTAVELLRDLPPKYREDLPVDHVGRMTAWLREARRKVALDQADVELEVLTLRRQGLAELRQGVERDADLLEERGKLVSTHDRNYEALDDYLRGVGRKLLRHAGAFANGAEVSAALGAAKTRYLAAMAHEADAHALLEELDGLQE